MADTATSDLTATTTPARTDILYIVDGGESRQVTVANVLSKATAADISDVTATAAELNVLDGITPTVTELNYVDGVTSAIQTQLDTKAPSSSPVLTTPQINDTSSDHQYVFAVSELAADRTVTLPLLTGNDEFVFKAHIQTLTNKTLTSPAMTTPSVTSGDVNLATGLNIQVNSADPNRTIDLPASAWTP
ncbi:MAG: hypothetical protein ACYSTS_11835, partial [Planctomycetota bacterium]